MWPENAVTPGAVPLRSSASEAVPSASDTMPLQLLLSLLLSMCLSRTTPRIRDFEPEAESESEDSSDMEA